MNLIYCHLNIITEYVLHIIPLIIDKTYKKFWCYKFTYYNLRYCVNWFAHNDTSKNVMNRFVAQRRFYKPSSRQQSPLKYYRTNVYNSSICVKIICCYRRIWWVSTSEHQALVYVLLNKYMSGLSDGKNTCDRH